MVSDSAEIKYAEEIPHFVTYLHRPNFSFPEKMEEMARLAKTPFLATCADDDFLVFETLGAFVQLLKENPSLAVTKGQFVATTDPDHGEIRFSIYAGEPPMKRTESDGLDRIRLFFRNYDQLVYAFHRRELLHDFYLRIAATVTHLHLIEILHPSYLMLKGGVQEISLPHYVRCYEPFSAGLTVGLYEQFYWFPSRKKAVFDFHLAFDSFLASSMGVGMVEASGLRKDILAGYLAIRKKSLRQKAYLLFRDLAERGGGVPKIIARLVLWVNDRLNAVIANPARKASLTVYVPLTPHLEAAWSKVRLDLVKKLLLGHRGSFQSS